MSHVSGLTNAEPDIVPSLTTPDTDYKKELTWLKEIVSSGSINFLFGAGVNGSAYPNFRNGFPRTKAKLVELGKQGNSIEDELSELEEAQYTEALEILIDEFNGIALPEQDSQALLNIRDLLRSIYRIVDATENRRPETKKVNIFTLNYDCIVEEILDACGFFYHTIAPNKPEPQVPYDVIGYNTTRKTYVPTFAVYKLHGSANKRGEINKSSIILPGKDKLGAVLTNYFELLFTMKAELLRKNAVLFALGYSGADTHINGVVRDAASISLTVCELPFHPKDTGFIEQKLDKQIFAPVAQGDEEYPDTTETLAFRLREACSLDMENAE